jgi:S1-C subfamily serine protease
MTEPTSPTEPPPERKEDSSNPMVVNPIHIARARHASMHGPSAIEKTRRVSTVKPPAAKTSSGWVMPILEALPLKGLNSLVGVLLLGLVFLGGSFFGGLVGGGLVLWANSPTGVTFLIGTPTPTLIFTPTPQPVATSTPTPTPQPVATASAEEIIAQIIPSVVTVINQQPLAAMPVKPDEGRVVGSGVIVDQRGFIATNHHVVENTGALNVILANGQMVEARLVATDPNQDLALLKVEVADLPAITWGDSTLVRPGQVVYAIGSPLGDFPSSVSFGIVSGLGRALEINQHVIDGLIQTDAAINRGSSGGPLVNAHGEAIGINTFIIRESEDRGVAEGIAFAIPAAAAQRIFTPWITAASGDAVPIPASGEPGN